MERTYVMIKPGFLQHEDAIIARIEGIGAKVSHKKVMQLDDEILNRHYAEHIGKGFFAELVNYMKSGKVIAMYVEREGENLVQDIRTIVGSTKDPAPGTIRHDFGIGEITRNVIHSSDSAESAARELGIFFPEFN
ncbi:MAG: nucleoside-diphosphate kinase [Clostridia bacterium]|nr:nucleoside-diphosphate kinase [Clostridia bacterium]